MSTQYSLTLQQTQELDADARIETIAGPGRVVNGSKPQIGQPAVAREAEAVLLISQNSRLVSALERKLDSVGYDVESVSDLELADTILNSERAPKVVLLDSMLSGMANGRLLARVHEAGLHKRCAIAVIAEEVSDEWIERLREGMIDDIVAYGSDAHAWKTHLNSMQRGHGMRMELEHLQERALVGLEHDPVTGVFNREATTAILFRETDRVQRLRGLLGLVMFSVDDMEHWQTELGQEGCDQLMLEVAGRAGRLLRSYDVLGRMASDAFLISVPGCSVMNAVLLAERLRVEVFGESFTVQRGLRTVQVWLTGSFGVTTSRGRTSVVVLQEVEATLNLARLAGPDAIRYANELPPISKFAEPVAELRREPELLLW